jgi:hypothetical protein
MRLGFRALAILLAAAPAAANPFTIGANLGASQAKDSTGDANRTLGAFGRLGLGDRIAGQLEIMQMTGQPGIADDIKIASAVLVTDFTTGPLVPVLLLGGGVDREQWASATYAHAEAGLGLELRTRAGFMVGADVRLGTRTLISQDKVVAEVASPWLYDPTTLHEGEYRSVRVTIGVTF